MNLMLGSISGETVAIVFGVLFLIYQIVTKALDHERETKRMKLESDLKIKLSENIEDPEVIERIARLKVLQGEKPGDAQQKIVEQHQQLALDKARRNAASTQPKVGRYVLPGLITLLLGIGFFVAAAISQDLDDLLVAGCVLGAIGLALLSYAVFLQDMAKKAYEREELERAG